jgi:hypothetical protein
MYPEYLKWFEKNKNSISNNAYPAKDFNQMIK